MSDHQYRDSKVTLCPSIYRPREVKYRSFVTVLQAFWSDESIKERVENVRNAPDKEAYADAKNELPIVIFGGQFSERNNEGLVRSSGLMVLDFDVHTEYESQKLRGQLEQDEYVYAFFLSTGGLGYRALVKIPEVTSDDEYKTYFYAINERYPNIDGACKDVARASFYTFDPDLVIKDDSKVWTEKRELEEKKNLKHTQYPINKDNDYTLANRVLNIIRYAVEGERHNKILKASRLMGGYVAAGDIEYHEGERLLKQEAQAIDPKDYRTNEKAVEDGMRDGMKEPVKDDKTLKKEEKRNELGKIYFTAKDAEPSIFHKYKHGIGEGWTVGYPSVDQIYKIFPGYFTTIYGSSFSGKSLIWFDFLKNLSHRYGLKHCIFSPETGSYDDVFIKLIEMAAERDFYDEYGNQMSEEDLRKAKDFVDRHFIVIDPGEHSLDLETSIEYLQIIERYYNVKVNTFTADPWNDLDHPMHEDNFREDKYLEKAIKKVRLAAHYNDWHICVITHSRDQRLVHDPTDNVKYYPPATFREIAGGQTWSRKGFQMASVWRPPKGLNEINGTKLEGDGSETLWFQQKYKPDWAGEIGVAKLKLDPKRHRFYEEAENGYKYADLSKKL